MPGQRSKPTFHAQATLIVLPVVILAAVGAWSLRQDRLLAEQEARDRARQLAATLLPGMAQRLAVLHTTITASASTQTTAPLESSRAIAFQIAADGQLLNPAPLAGLVPQPLDPNRLDPELARLWDTARAAQFRDPDIDTAVSAYGDFLEREPPDGFAATARISLATLEAQAGRQPEAMNQLRFVIEHHFQTPLESGLPAQAVAALKLIELELAEPGSATDNMSSAALLEMACSNSVGQPTWVSRPLIDAAANLGAQLDLPQLTRWRTLWNHHEHARRLFNDARRHLQSPGPIARTGLMADPQLAGVAPDRAEPAGTPGSQPIWIRSQAVAWLVLADTDVRADRWIVCLSEDVVRREIDTVLSGAGDIPSYFGLGVSLGQRQYRVSPLHDPSASQSQALAPSAPGATESPHPRLSGLTLDRAAVTGASLPLASVSQAFPWLGQLGVDIYLDDPSLLFARQRTRTFWFGALIAASASAALVGLVTAWRAFHRQQLLAEAQSRFVSSVSHELRAPIGSIRLLAEGLESGRISGPDKQSEYFALMGQECRRLTALIENVLDFSRIDQGRKQYEFEPTDVVALVCQTVRLMEPQAVERQVTLNLQLPVADHGSRTADHETTGSHPQPVLDGRAIQQALVNLIDNAIKHAPPHSTVEVGLAFERLVQPPAQPPAPAVAPSAPLRLRIWVGDSGEGIPTSEHEKIFEPFYRRGTELRRETHGIGIGLSLVKHIVEAHGGRVTLESEPGRGCKFALHIP
jgi:signal transduction histidine kinase